LINKAVADWNRLCRHRKTLCFAVTLDHSRALASAFQMAGIDARHVDGTMTRIERADIMEKFRAGSISVLCSVNVLTEGKRVSYARRWQHCDAPQQVASY
jgi:DNA repair protein RadD